MLCNISTEDAIELIESVDDASLFRASWLPELIFRRPREIKKKLLSIARGNKNHIYFLQSIYSGYENLIDSETLIFFLDSLEAENFEQIIIGNDDSILRFVTQNPGFRVKMGKSPMIFRFSPE